jgi:hypothetical protein
MLKLAAPFFVAVLSGTGPADSCALSQSDEAWIAQSIRAWNYSARHLSGIGHLKKIEAVLFDNSCVISSKTAMNGGRLDWARKLHHGSISLPDGQAIKPDVVSFAGSNQGESFFVMSTPSVWRAAGKTGKGTTLENLMTAVMLHEGTHVAQMPTYGAKIGAIAERHKLPEAFNDDSIQKQFAGNAQFAASVEREARLLFGASRAKSRREAIALVRSARALMKARYSRWFTGKDSYLADVEPIWLTLEGSGQWLAYRWLTDPRGGNESPANLRPGFVTDKWWSQREGFAAFLALERLTGRAWRREAFQLGRKNALQMLDEAIATRR